MPIYLRRYSIRRINEHLEARKKAEEEAIQDAKSGK